jgi:dolichyl-phosphate beta-glucosyltransferase
MKTFDVIIPLYNEEGSLVNTLGAIRNFSKTYPHFRFIFVNDGSTDQTLKILKKNIKNPLREFRIVSYRDNRGKGFAIRKGIEFSTSSNIAFIDADLAYPLNHLLSIEKSLETSDVVIGCRGLSSINWERINLKRIFIGKSFNILLRTILFLPYKDTQAGLKGFKKNIAKKIFSKQKINGFAFDTEVLYLAKKYGASIEEISAEVSEDHSTSPSKVKIVRDSINMFTSLFKIRLNDLAKNYS